MRPLRTALGAQRMRFAEARGLMTLTAEPADGTEIVLNRGGSWRPARSPGC